MSEITHVAVAVIVNDSNQVCISLRHADSHQGGRWEFPGGKIEPHETVDQALVREIREELGVTIQQSRPLITINHDYHDKRVCLHVRKILRYHGEAKGLEGQQVKWVKIAGLADYRFPQANLAIIKAVQLPEKYLVTGGFTDTTDFIARLSTALANGIRLVQLRLKHNSLQDAGELQSLVEQAAGLCERAGASLMLNLAPGYLQRLDLSRVEFAGIHADSHTLKKLSRAPAGMLFSASCHDAEELAYAEWLNADFVVLSPVQATPSHPGMEAMGWPQFSTLIESISMPVYALGGVSEKDLETAWSHGAQGIAGISAFWR